MRPEADLASRWLGGSVIAASDESFGEKENLLTPSVAAFEPGRYGHRGEIVDGYSDVIDIVDLVHRFTARPMCVRRACA